MNTETLAPKLTRLAALAEATVDQIFATLEDENLSVDSSIGMAVELGRVLQEEISQLRQQVSAERRADLDRRVNA